jgi:hypothetical protein
MTISYDNEIIASIIKILIDDNNNPNLAEGDCSIHYYVEDRIIQVGAMNSSAIYPQITVDYESWETASSVPSQRGEATITIWIDKATVNAKTIARRIGARVIDLLDRKAGRVNAQGCDAKVRTIQKASATLNLQGNKDDNLINYQVVLDVVHGDEWDGSN